MFIMAHFKTPLMVTLWIRVGKSWMQAAPCSPSRIEGADAEVLRILDLMEI